MSAPTITITQAQLEAALAGWERDARGGNRISEAERAAMTPEEIGAASAPYLLNALQQILKQSGALA